MVVRAQRGIRPSTQNRPESVEAVWVELSDSLSHAEKLLTWLPADTERDVRERKMGAVGVACRQQFDSIMTVAVCGLWQGNTGAPERLREAFSWMYWGAEVAQHERLRERIGYDVRDSTLLGRLWLHGLAAAGGAPDIADWAAPYLLNLLSTGDGTGGTLELTADTPFRLFFRQLLSAQVKRRWSSDIDRTAMRAYGDLLGAAQDPEAFRQALVEFCDYRIAQALRFDGMDARKRRPESVTRSVLDVGGWIRLFPLELFSMRYVYEKTMGVSLSLEADHPLLKTPLMRLPALLPLYQDRLIRQVTKTAEEVFRTQWKPLNPVPLILDSQN
jgi:hypothetical protein